MIIYKYIDYNILKVIKNNSLKFTSREYLNDPFELFPYFEPNESQIHDIFYNLNDDFVQYNPYKIEDNTNWVQNYYNDLVPGFINILNNTFGILSLTEDPLNLLMWSHYADNHKGFVIGFDTNNEFFNEKNNNNLKYRNLREVNYEKQRPIINDPFNTEELNESFFCKSAMWNYEKEWRVLRRLDDADEIDVNNNLYLFSFEPNIVKEIYFGLRSDVKKIKQIFDVIQQNSNFKEISFFQIELDKKEFKLIPKKIATP